LNLWVYNGAGFRVQGSGFMVPGISRVQAQEKASKTVSVGFGVFGSEFWGLGFGFYRVADYPAQSIVNAVTRGAVMRGEKSI